MCGEIRVENMVGNSHGSSTDQQKSKDAQLDDTISKKSKGTPVEQLQEIPSINKAIAHSLVDNGFESIQDIANSSIDSITDTNKLSKAEAMKIKEEVKDIIDGTQDEVPEKGQEGGAPSNAPDEDDLANWLTGESDQQLDDVLGSGEAMEEVEGEVGPGGEKPSGQATGSMSEVEEAEDVEALKSWLSGEEESFSGWLGEESFEEEKEELKQNLKEKRKELEQKEKELEVEREELDNLRKKFEQGLEDLVFDEFDPEELLEKNAKLEKKLEDKEEEIERLEEEKRDLEEDLAQIKKGSVAMVKYLKSKKGEAAEAAKVDKEQLKKLKSKNKELKEKVEELKSREPVAEGEGEPSDMSEKLEKKEKEITEREQEIEKLKDKLDDLHDKVKYKEEQLNEREEDLRQREEMVRKERKEVERLKKEYGGTTEEERKKQLQDLEDEIEKKEQELKAKEKYIEQKERELKARQEEMIDEELEERQEEVLREIEEEKGKTGTNRLDDLLLGGIPLGSNVSIYGPPHVGKEVLINSFVAEGLEKGIPAIWVITDKTVDDVREEMKFVLPTYEEYEMRNLVYYVDAYSASMGEKKDMEEDKDYIKYIEEQSDVKAITKAVDEFAEELKENHRYYRMAFESVSTVIAYLDTQTTFRILQPFAGRRKKDNAIALYTLEKGMHSEQDISMLGHMMNGEIQFKVEQLKNYLRVEGLGDVQTRDWVEYTSSKSGINMGSFSLDTIR